MTDISTLTGGPARSWRPTNARGRVVRPPASVTDALTVRLVNYSADYEYEVPGTNWMAQGTSLPIFGELCLVWFDDDGDAWMMPSGEPTFPAGDGGGGGAETDPVASAALTAHAADTTAIHGIADTAALVVTTDPRLSDARAPTAHTHPQSDVTGLTAALAAKQDASTAATDAELSTHAADTTAVHGIADTSLLVVTSDPRLSDQRVPTDGSVTNAKVAGAAAIARSKLDFGSGLVNADIAAAAGIAKSKLAALAIVNADVDAAAAIVESKLALASDAAAGTASRRTLGTGAQQAAAGNDSRLSDARAPTAHTHPAADIASGTIATDRLGSGTADSTKFLRGDQSWAAPPAGGGTPTVGLFRVYRNAAQSVGNGAQVTFDTEVFDVSNYYTPGTGRYLPGTAGYYRLSWSVSLGAIITADLYMRADLRKNGTRIMRGQVAFQRGTAVGITSVGTDVVQANGTTDFFDIVLATNSAGALTLAVGAIDATLFGGELVG